MTARIKAGRLVIIWEPFNVARPGGRNAANGLTLTRRNGPANRPGRKMHSSRVIAKRLLIGYKDFFI